MTTTLPVLSADGIRVTIGGRAVLTGVGLAVAPGELVSVMGPSGSGKSCLLAVLGGLLAPDAGTVQLHGTAPVPDAARTGLLLQGLALVAVLTAAENVEVPLQAARRPQERQEISRRAAEALERVDLTEHADKLVEHLSGGQRQRVALARALAPRPGLLLLDEPTSALDARSRRLVLELLAEEAERGTAVVIATHDQEVADWTDRVLTLREGAVIDE